MSNDYPENLKTERLITKFLSLTDVMEWSLFFRHPEAIRFLFIESLGLSSDEAVAQSMIQKQLDRYQDKRYGLQNLIHRESGLFIGCCGLLVQEVNGNQEVEVGYHIFPTYWGQGYATEAAKCFIDFAFKSTKLCIALFCWFCFAQWLLLRVFSSTSASQMGCIQTKRNGCEESFRPRNKIF